jgi:hypothetical protein
MFITLPRQTDRLPGFSCAYGRFTASDLLFSIKHGDQTPEWRQISQCEEIHCHLGPIHIGSVAGETSPQEILSPLEKTTKPPASADITFTRKPPR